MAHTEAPNTAADEAAAPERAGCLVTHLREHPDEVAGYLDSHLLYVLVDGDLRSFLLGLRGAVAARGWSAVAREAGVSREHLYRALSANGNPEMRTITAVLRALRLRLAVAPLTAEDAAYAQSGASD